MERALYRLYGIDMAVQLLRPNAKWEITNNFFSLWDDPRPCPTMEEVYYVMEKIKEFEDQIPTIWLPEDEEKLKNMANDFDRSVNEHP
jgi:hypothetical protein